MTTPRSESRILGRRDFLRDASVAGIAGLIGAQSATSALAASAPRLLASSCVLTPAGPAGPFYAPLGLLRRDLREAQPGLAMTLLLRVVRSSDCSPVQGAFADLWHNNAGGTYSAFVAQGTAGETWLRGVQVTNANGLALFETIYPGWYPGRTCHLHLKIHTPTDVFTTQLYATDRFSTSVWRQEPYASHGPNPTTNAIDSFYEPAATLALQPLGLAAFPWLGGGMKRVLGAKTLVIA